MNTWENCLICLLVAAALAGCLPPQQQMRLEQDLEEMKRRLAFVERRIVSEDLDLQDETGRTLTSLARRQADTEADMDNLRVELQALQGRLDEMSRETRQLRDEMNLLRDDVSLKTAHLEDRLAGNNPSSDSSASAGNASPPFAEKKPEDLYKEALIMVRDKKQYPEARKIFQAFLREYPDHHLAVNVAYWIGEAYYGEKQYENAILQFQDVIQKYSDHPKAASAMYKQAFAFHAMGDKKNARVLLEKLIQTYPKAPESDLAKDKIKEWKQ